MEWASFQRTSQSCCVQGTENEVGNSETGFGKQGLELTETLQLLAVMNAS